MRRCPLFSSGLNSVGLARPNVSARLSSDSSPLKLLSYFPAADELRQQAIVSLIMADAAGDDCGVDVGFAGEGVDCQYCGSFTHGAGRARVGGG